jgi:hypothetical protein
MMTPLRVEIESSYWPPGLTAGLAVSAAALAVLAGLAAAPALARRPARRAGAPAARSGA